jgi:hypothetical protein
MKVNAGNMVRTALCASLLGGWVLANAQDTQSNAPAPDSTKVNQRDRSYDWIGVTTRQRPTSRR